MATAGSKQGGGGGGGGGCCKPKPPPAAADQAELDPKYEWQEDASSFILRIHLSGFRKEDFRVQVDGAGRLTVRGQRSDAATNARHSRFSKVFQLPSTSNLDNIAGRFDAGVLTLTVPKRLPAKQQQVQADQSEANKQQAKAPPAAMAPPPQEQEQEQEQRKAKEDQQAKKPKDDEDEAATATSKKPEQPKPAVRGEEEEDKPKAGGASAAAPPAAVTDTKQAATPKPELPPPQADAERTAVDPESLAERVNRRAQQERAAAERQSKACHRGFKERVAEELQGLAGSEWAEGLVETVKRNREVIAVAVAAFSLGVFVSSKLFSRSRNGN